jgi:SAM-dependent methyltransferase
VDPACHKREVRSAYQLGDYTWLSRLLEPAAVALVDACGLDGTDRVLDVAAGDGNAALAAARLGARVTALDLSPRQLELGRARAAQEGLEVRWLEGDAELLPFRAGVFDAVVSNFGAIYSPRPDVAAAEAFRVVRAGGRVALTAWPPESFNARLQKAVAEHAGLGDPAPEDAWGTEEGCRALLARHASRVDVRRLAYVREFPSVEAMWRLAAQHVPPLVALAERLGPERFERLGEDCRRVLYECNLARDGTLALEAEYLLAVARR